MVIRGGEHHQDKVVLVVGCFGVVCLGEALGVSVRRGAGYLDGFLEAGVGGQAAVEDAANDSDAVDPCC